MEFWRWVKDRPGGISVFITGALLRLSIVERLVGLLSGAVLDDTAKTMDNVANFFGSPLLGNSLLGFGLVLIFWRPLYGLYVKAERSLLGIDQQAAPTKELRAVGSPSSAVSAPIGSGNHIPGALDNSVHLRQILLERQMIRAGQIAGIPRDKYPAPKRCPICAGNGQRWGIHSDACHKCFGTGELPGELSIYPKCKPCGGNGHKAGIHSSDCPYCHGLGVRFPR